MTLPSTKIDNLNAEKQFIFQPLMRRPSEDTEVPLPWQGAIPWSRSIFLSKIK
jgi:hypothetical protein